MRNINPRAANAISGRLDDDDDDDDDDDNSTVGLARKEDVERAWTEPSCRSGCKSVQKLTGRLLVDGRLATAC